MNTPWIVTGVAAASLALAACGAGSAEPQPAPRPPAVESPAEPPPARTVGAEDAATAARAINALGADLFARLAGSDPNLAISPASVEAAMAMVTAGARGQTREELERGLHLRGLGDDAIDALGQELRRWEEAQTEGVTLRVANRLFGAQGLAFDEAYIELLRASFAAPLERLDFEGAPEPSREHINAWVEERTNDRIEDLLPPGAITPDARLVLVNALYVDARWKAPFDPNATQPLPFTLASGERVTTDTMRREASMAYASRQGATIVELPYAGGTLAMRFILPPEGQSPEAWATADNLSDDTPLGEARVALSVPKFRIDGATIALGNVLRQLGMTSAFTPSVADFGGMVADGSRSLALSDVYHQVFVRVDEKGTEAAAATAPVMATTGAPMPPPDRVVVRFDRPFLFVLRDTRTGAVLFLGRVGDPRTGR